MTKQSEILAKLASGEITAEQAATLLDKANEKPITFKVGEKGGVSVYGLARFPTTLYGSQWERLLAKSDELLKFIEANRANLSVKKAAA